MNDSDHQLVTRFDDIYNLPDCRAYYREMMRARYRNAHHASMAFKSVFKALKKHRNIERPCVLDFASGYGIGALLLRHRLTLDQVMERYQDDRFDDASVEQVVEWDRDWLRQRRDTEFDCSVFAIDVADRALDYGVRTGILDDAFATDLQTQAPSKELITWLGQCDLIIEVGSVAHMLPAVLGVVLNHSTTRMPWIITSPIRGNESDETMKLMKRAGYTVETMPVLPFQHRIFMDSNEQQRAIDLVTARGLDTRGYEEEGAYHAQLYLARPEHERTPVTDWL